VDDGGGDIAALQAQATLTLRQAAGMSFDRIMVSAAKSHVVCVTQRVWCR
jgi:hypothetical protein